MTGSSSPYTSSPSFGAQLRHYRKLTGLTYCDIAEHLGVSTPYLSDVERGVRPPLTLARIEGVVVLVADALDLPGARPGHSIAVDLVSRALAERPVLGVDLSAWPDDRRAELACQLLGWRDE